MAHITLNTNTALTSAAFTLPDNARIVVIDTDTDEETADLTINGAELLTITGDNPQITSASNTPAAPHAVSDEEFVQSVIAEMLNMLNVDHDTADNTATDTTDAATPAAPAPLTAIREDRSVDYSYTVRVTYNSANDTYTDLTTGNEIIEGAIVDIINRASETDATATMTFDIPGHGITTFAGELLAGYNGYNGIVLVGSTGGAYVLDAEHELTDDMAVLNEATFTFIGDADMLFADLNVNIIDIDEYEARTADATINDDDENDDADDTDAIDINTATRAAQQRVRTFDADEQLYVSIYSRSHDLRSADIRRIVEYAATNGLSARMTIDGMVTSYDGTTEPYVGRLEVRDTDTNSRTYAFVDKKFGVGKINLNDKDGDPGFNVLEIYSDTEMRRRGFAGTNHTDYTEISVVEMAKHINTALDV